MSLSIEDMIKQLKGYEKSRKELASLYKDKADEYKNILKQLTPEELKKVKRYQKRANECVKNNDQAGLMNLQMNFK